MGGRLEAQRRQARARAPPRAGLAWFKNEHDEEPAAPLADLTPDQLGALADELVRTRDGQIVLGRAVPAEEAARWTEAQYRMAALETFRTLAPLYRLRS